MWGEVYGVRCGSPAMGVQDIPISALQNQNMLYGSDDVHS